MGDTVALFVDRCVMCTRCVRFTREITGTAELMVINRGSHEEIDVFPGFPLENGVFAGNVVDLCPVGGLGDKVFSTRSACGSMKQHAGICTGCSTGCSITVDENQEHVYRLKPRANPHVNDWWMCDEGRYGYHHVHSDKRLTSVGRASEGGNGHAAPSTIVDGPTNVEWSEALVELIHSCARRVTWPSCFRRI